MPQRLHGTRMGHFTQAHHQDILCPMERLQVTVRALLALFTLAVCDCGGESNEYIENHYYGYGGEVITHTPTDVPLVDIEIPEDVDDDVVVGTVNPALIDLANGVKHENVRSGFGLYSVSTVSNETKVDNITGATVSGFYWYESNNAGNVIVRVEFHVPYTPNASGLKSFEIPVPTTAPAATGDFTDGQEAMGIANVFLGSVQDGADAQVYAATGTKRVRVEWYDTETSGVGRLVRGTYTYIVIP